MTPTSPLSEQQSSPTPAHTPPRWMAWVRWLAFIGIVGALAWLIPNLPLGLRQWVLPALMIFGGGALIVVGWRNLRTTAMTAATWHSFNGLRRRWAWIAGMMTVGLMIAASLYPTTQNAINSDVLFFVVGALIAGSIWREQRRYPFSPLVDWRYRLMALLKPTTSAIRWYPLVCGIAMLTLLVQINIIGDDERQLAWFDGLWHVSYHVQVLLLVGGAICLIIGLGGYPYGVWRRHRLRIRWHHIALLVILCVGLVVRLWQLETWITRWLDELLYANAVGMMTKDNAFILTPFHNVTAFTWLYPYIQVHSTALLGPSFTALRIISVVCGMLQILAVYQLAALLFNRRVALFSALITAVLAIYLHFSRIGIANIADPMLATWGFYWLVRGLRDERPLDFAIAGVLFGFTQYFYEGGRLFYMPFVLLWLGWLLLFMRQREAARFRFPSASHLLRLAIPMLALTVTLYYVWLVNEVDLTPRLNTVGDRILQLNVNNEALSINQRITLVVERTLLVLRRITLLADTSNVAWLFGGQRPLLPFYLVPFFFMGLARAAWRIRHAGGALLVWWLLGAAVGIGLVADNSGSPRYLVMLPAVVMLVALGIDQTWRVLFGRTTRRYAAMLLVVFASFFTVAELSYYFNQHLATYYKDHFYNNFHPDGGRLQDTEDALLRATQLPANTHAMIITRGVMWQFDLYTVPMYYGRSDLIIQHEFINQFGHDTLDALPWGKNLAFFIEPEDRATFEIIAERYALDPHRFGVSSPYNIPKDVQLWLYFVPAEANQPYFDDETDDETTIDQP